jgi:hypothetical protein
VWQAHGSASAQAAVASLVTGTVVVLGALVVDEALRLKNAVVRIQRAGGARALPDPKGTGP